MVVLLRIRDWDQDSVGILVLDRTGWALNVTKSKQMAVAERNNALAAVALTIRGNKFADRHE